MAQNETRTEDNYLHCDRYAGHESAGVENYPLFTKFQDPETDLYYFSYLDAEDGSVIFRSEGYPTTAARDNGIDSVTRNMDMEERYKIVQFPDGLWYVSLRAGNHQEIARSCGYESEAAASYLTPSGQLRRHEERMEAHRARMAAEALAASATATNDDDAERANNREEDNYLACKEYAGHERDAENADFAKFQHSNGEYYFVMYDDEGDVLLRSEGYPTTAARDNGMRSVITNRDNEARYAEKTMLNGYTYVSLKAGNHQEIARSCPKKPSAAPVVETPVVEIAAAAVAAATVIETPEPVVEVAAPAVEVVAPEVHKEREDDYLHCDEYKGKTINDKQNNVALFKHENGQFYFVLYNEDGSVKLRSEGFESAKTRDEELSGVLRYHDKPEMYDNIERAGHIIRVLKDKTGREVGRSCLEKIPVAVVETPAPVVETPAPVVEIAAAAAVVTAAAAIDVPEAKVEVAAPERSAEKEDDYLPCDAYKNKFVNDKVNNVALFKHDDGQYYFVLYNEDGSVKLRSEGFKNTKTRDEELSGVLKYHKDSSMYTNIEKAGHIIRILKDKTGREVGRSCLEKVAVAAAPAAIVPPVVVPPVPPVVEAAAPIIEETSGGFKLWWLLPLLLLPLLWFMCNKCKPEVKAPAVEVKKEEPKPVVPATKLSIKSFLPVVLYFDNDQPDANRTAKTTAKTYAQSYDAYYGMRSEFSAKGDGAATTTFFDNDVKKGMADLAKLAAALKDIVASGEKANIKIKGFASPLAKGDYNKALTGRRVSSVENYLKSYDASLAKAMTDGSLKITFEENGEDASKGVTDSAKDKKGSIYGVDASKERRVEIVGVE